MSDRRDFLKRAALAAGAVPFARLNPLEWDKPPFRYVDGLSKIMGGNWIRVLSTLG